MLPNRDLWEAWKLGLFANQLISMVGARRRGPHQGRSRPPGKQPISEAKRFIQTVLREWAYARAYHTSDQRPPSCRFGRTNIIGIVRTAA
jgi:hypothetical protein